MNHCGIQQTSNLSSFNNGEPVVCPKPRRFHLLNTELRKPLTFHMWYGAPDQEICESRSCEQLLDLMLPEHTHTLKPGGGGSNDVPEQTHILVPLPSSPPFFCGSPPSRVSNPLIQDARFKEEKICSTSPHKMIPNPGSGVASSSPAYNMRTSYNNKPTVRIEGFSCLENNRRNCSVPAFA